MLGETLFRIMSVFSFTTWWVRIDFFKRTAKPLIKIGLQKKFSDFVVHLRNNCVCRFHCTRNISFVLPFWICSCGIQGWPKVMTIIYKALDNNLLALSIEQQDEKALSAKPNNTQASCSFVFACGMTPS